MDNSVKKHNYIRDNIIIDFTVPDRLQEVIKEAEELDAKRDIDFIHVADLIDNMCKGYYSQGHMTRRQWDLIAAKYPVNADI